MVCFKLRYIFLLIFWMNTIFIIAQSDQTENLFITPTASNFTYPQSLFVDSYNGNIWVTDFDNNRVMRFDGHGGTPQGRREQLIDRFQSGDPTTPVFVLSLKAGGVGLNLTAANHVFHYDRWWNPAVENQATDRAFRIGQQRTVNVHKMISAGTLEERIDQMIEQKTELATQIIGSGESWLTELSTGQLRDLLSLRRASLEDPA